MALLCSTTSCSDWVSRQSADKAAKGMLSLAQKLRETADKTSASISSETKLIMENATKKLAQSSLSKRFLKVGDKAPNFKLPNAQGGKLELKDLLENNKAVVVSFYRGGWCIYCNLELNMLQGYLPEFRKAGAELVAVSPEQPDKTALTMSKHHLQFPVLSDKNNRTARKYHLVFKLAKELRPIYEKFGVDLREYNGNSKYELPVPATFVIDKSRTIRYVFADVDYTKRAEPAEILKVLKSL